MLAEFLHRASQFASEAALPFIFDELLVGARGILVEVGDGVAEHGSWAGRGHFLGDEVEVEGEAGGAGLQRAVVGEAGVDGLGGLQVPDGDGALAVDAVDALGRLEVQVEGEVVVGLDEVCGALEAVAFAHAGLGAAEDCELPGLELLGEASAGGGGGGAVEVHGCDAGLGEPGVQGGAEVGEG